MTTKHQPATPLPWQWLPDEGQFIVNGKRDIVAEVPCQGAEPQDGAYLVHAANAYQRLVEALRGITEMIGKGWIPPDEIDYASADDSWDAACIAFRTSDMQAKARALLRELGEV